MTTTHQIIQGKAQQISSIEDSTVDLILTSPPYPMIVMWDDILTQQNQKIRTALDQNNPTKAYELMHQELDKVWHECYRVLRDGGFACINIGDATRTINKQFGLYANHARIIQAFIKMGMTHLPNILWRKPTNAPNKFMGSGMLPSGAYVTLEHEWILVFRKGGKRKITREADKIRRRQSAFFWEERNQWFSDIWEFRGTRQDIGDAASRKRNAAFPFELPYRLIQMYSMKDDTVLDPFLGTGTTTLAAIATQRNSIGCEIDSTFIDLVKENIAQTPLSFYHKLWEKRLNSHLAFIEERSTNPKKTAPKYHNDFLNCPVMTRQETELCWKYVKEVNIDSGNVITATYSDEVPQ